MLLWPRNGFGSSVTDELKVRLLERINGQEERLRTIDDVAIPIIWSTPCFGESDKVAVIFHGNGNQLYDRFMIREVASFYHERGVNVIVATYRGYPEAEGSAVASGEQGVIYDTDAIGRYILEERGFAPENVWVHGLSMGSAYAATLAVNHNFALTVDHGFTSGVDVVRAQVEGIRCLSSLAHIVGRYADYALFPAGEEVTDSTAQAETDGLDTLSKVARLARPVFIAFGNQDELMPIRFAEEFADARGADPAVQLADLDFVAEIDGGHFHKGAITSCKDAAAKLARYLVEHGFFTE